MKWLRYRDHPLDDLAAYALDAIDDAREREVIEAHLASCEPCRHRLAVDEATLSCLVADEPPPAEVWAAIDARTGGAGPRGSCPGRVRAACARRRRRRAAAAAPAPPAGRPLARPRPRCSRPCGRARRSSAPGRRRARSRRRGGRGTARVLTVADGTEVARVADGPRGAVVELVGVDPLPEGRDFQMWRSTAPGPCRWACSATAGTRGPGGAARRHHAGRHQRRAGAGGSAPVRPDGRHRAAPR